VIAGSNCFWSVWQARNQFSLWYRAATVFWSVWEGRNHFNLWYRAATVFLECVTWKETLQFVIPGSNCFFGVCDKDGITSVCDTGQQLFFGFWSVWQGRDHFSLWYWAAAITSFLTCLQADRSWSLVQCIIDSWAYEAMPGNAGAELVRIFACGRIATDKPFFTLGREFLQAEGPLMHIPQVPSWQRRFACFGNEPGSWQIICNCMIQ